MCLRIQLRHRDIIDLKYYLKENLFHNKSKEDSSRNLAKRVPFL